MVVITLGVMRFRLAERDDYDTRNPQPTFRNPMQPQDAVDLTREAMMLALLIGSPVLAAGLVVGLVVGLLQALTQVQEQTVAFVPKLVAMVLVLSLLLPWLIARLVDYTHDLIQNIPQTL